MIIPIIVSNPKRSTLSLELEAVLDTGYTGAIVLPLAVAEKLHVPITDAERSARDASGNVMPGFGATVTVAIADADVSAKVTAFVREGRGVEVLLGEYYLAHVGSSITIGDETYDFSIDDLEPNPKGRRSKFNDPNDLSWMTFTNRPRKGFPELSWSPRAPRRGRRK